MQNARPFLLAMSLIAIGLFAAESMRSTILAAEPGVLAGSSLTPEQKAALAALDSRLAGVETLARKIDDGSYKVEVVRQIEDLKKSRSAIEKDFDQGRYEVLMHSVISRYQVIALWLKSPPPQPTGHNSGSSAPRAGQI